MKLSHPPLRLSLCLAFALAALAPFALHGAALVSNSPFAPTGAAGMAASAAQDNYQLAGSTSQGTDVSVCIYATQTKRSLWIPVGGEVDGVHVISYDDTNDIAVVKVGGGQKSLSMRKATIGSARATSQSFAAAEASPAPAPIADAGGPKSADSIQREQREARMLVSDLLEIGVQQRKAYQEAKAKAAANPQQ